MYSYKASEYLKPEENINIHKNAVNEDCGEHIHDFIEMVYTLTGTASHFIDGVCYPVEKGDLLFINFKQTHSFTVTGPMVYVNCLIQPEFLSDELVDSENAYDILALAAFEDLGGPQSSINPAAHFRGKDLLEIEAVIERMLAEFNEKSFGYKSILKAYTGVLLAKTFREMRLEDSGGIFHQVNKITPEIIKYIEENFCEKISLTELAQKCFYNPSYFSRVFKDYYGKNLTEYIHEKRLNEAYRLLKESRLTVEAVCHAVGYSDKKQFYKLFKQYYGSTPNKIREGL